MGKQYDLRIESAPSACATLHSRTPRRRCARALEDLERPRGPRAVVVVVVVVVVVDDDDDDDDDGYGDDDDAWVCAATRRRRRRTRTRCGGDATSHGRARSD